MITKTRKYREVIIDELTLDEQGKSIVINKVITVPSKVNTNKYLKVLGISNFIIVNEGKEQILKYSMEDELFYLYAKVVLE